MENEKEKTENREAEQSVKKSDDNANRKILRDNSIFKYEEVPTRYSITKSEQRVLIFLVIIISVCLGINYYKSSSESKEFIYSANILGAKNAQNQAYSLKSDNTGNNENQANSDSAISYSQNDYKKEISSGNNDKTADAKEISTRDINAHQPGINEKLQMMDNAEKNNYPDIKNPGISADPSDKSAISGKIDLNTADAEELTLLKGIGPQKAQAIVEYRKQHGGFSKTEELKDVNGIGDKTYEKIKDEITILSPEQKNISMVNNAGNNPIENSNNLNNSQISQKNVQGNGNINSQTANNSSAASPPQNNSQTAEPPVNFSTPVNPQSPAVSSAGNPETANVPQANPQSPNTQLPDNASPDQSSKKQQVLSGKININTASAEDLKKLYRVGDVIAERIIEYRKSHGGFKTIDELKNVKGVGETIFQKNKDYITVR